MAEMIEYIGTTKRNNGLVIIRRNDQLTKQNLAAEGWIPRVGGEVPNLSKELKREKRDVVDKKFSREELQAMLDKMPVESANEKEFEKEEIEEKVIEEITNVITEVNPKNKGGRPKTKTT